MTVDGAAGVLPSTRSRPPRMAQSAIRAGPFGTLDRGSHRCRSCQAATVGLNDKCDACHLCGSGLACAEGIECRPSCSSDADYVAQAGAASVCITDNQCSQDPTVACRPGSNDCEGYGTCMADNWCTTNLRLAHQLGLSERAEVRSRPDPVGRWGVGVRGVDGADSSATRPLAACNRPAGSAIAHRLASTRVLPGRTSAIPCARPPPKGRRPIQPLRQRGPRATPRANARNLRPCKGDALPSLAAPKPLNKTGPPMVA